MNRFLSLFLLIPAAATAFGQYLDFTKYGWQYLDTGNSELPSNYVTDLFLDAGENIWVSTTADPLIRINKGGRWEDVAKTGHATVWWMNDWCQTGSVRYFIAGNSHYILAYHSGYLTYDTIPVPNETPSVLEANEQGTVLIGCKGGPKSTHNLYQLTGGKKLESLNDRYGDVFCIWVEDKGDLLVSFREGLYRFKKRADGTYQEGGKLVSEQAFYEVAVDENGVIWGTSMEDGYLHSYQNGQWITHKGGPRDLFCNYRGETRYVAYNLLLLGDGRVMISTQFNTGIAVYDGNSWKAYKPELKVQGDGITRLVLGPDGSIWCATSKNGLAVFRPVVFIKPRQKRIRPKAENDTIIARYERPADEGAPVPYIPDSKRKVKTSRVYYTEADTAMIMVWDSRRIDGDTVSVYCNGNARVSNRPLTAVQDTFYMPLVLGDNEILLFAHNLGSIPPNTATLTVVVGAREYHVILTSDLNTCERILIRKSRVGGE